MKHVTFILLAVCVIVVNIACYAEELPYPVNNATDGTAEVVAQSAPDAASEDTLKEIMQLLEENSELATRTRMNVDFVPGVMTVLHGSDLEARGVQNVYDALGLVPGMPCWHTVHWR